MSVPSDRATEAAEAAVRRSVIHGHTYDIAFAALAAAHDPALGLDRSVRLGDVVEALRATTDDRDPDYATVMAAADFIEREFGGQDG